MSCDCCSGRSNKSCLCTVTITFPTPSSHGDQWKSSNIVNSLREGTVSKSNMRVGGNKSNIQDISPNSSGLTPQHSKQRPDWSQEKMNSTEAVEVIPIACRGLVSINAHRFSHIKPASFVGLLASCAFNAASAIVGAVANALVIAAIKRNSSLHSNAYYVLVVLAVCDLLTSCLTLPTFVAVHVETLVNRVTSCATTAAWEAFRNMTVMASLFATLGVSMERALAVMAPYWYVEHVTPFRLVAPPACLWALVMAIETPRYFSVKLYLPAFARSLLVLTCLVVTVITYSVLVRTARRHRQEITALAWSAQTEEARKKKVHDNKSLNMATYVVGAALLSYIPLIVLLVFVRITDPEPGLNFYLEIMVGNFVFPCSIVNPFVYCWRNSMIRNAMVKLLKPGQAGATDKGGNASGTSRGTDNSRSPETAAAHAPST